MSHTPGLRCRNIYENYKNTLSLSLTRASVCVRALRVSYIIMHNIQYDECGTLSRVSTEKKKSCISVLSGNHIPTFAYDLIPQLIPPLAHTQ